MLCAMHSRATVMAQAFVIRPCAKPILSETIKWTDTRFECECYTVYIEGNVNKGQLLGACK